MGCIASKPDQTRQQKRFISPQTYTKLELSLRLLASRAADLRRRHRRPSGDDTWLLGGSASSDEVCSAVFSSEVEMGPGSVNIAAQAVLMLVFPEGEGKEGGEMDTWQRRIAYVERSILPVASQLVRFDYSDILSATRNFDKGRELGRGALSRVYRGRIGVTRKSVAIKKIEARDQESLNSFCRELTIAGSVRHPNIVPLIGFCADKEGLFLIYKFVSGGTLDFHLHDQHERKGRWSIMRWEERYKVAIGVAKAVQFLHFGTNKCVIHRDIKPSNILISSKNVPKLCDFGMATWTHGPSLPFLCKSVKGTFGYLAPEYFQHGKLSDKTDVYSFGVVLLELITGRKAIDRSRPPGDENLVLWARPLLQQGEGGIHKLIDPHLKFDDTNNCTNHSTELARMIRAATACLSTDESNRPSINQVISILQDHSTCERDWAILTNSGCLTGYGLHYPVDKRDDMRSHLALAMLGVSDTEEDEMYGR